MHKFLSGSITASFFLILFHSPGESFAQASQTVSEIITTYNSYFKSSTTNVNPVLPDNSHELLAFTFSGVRYSTGVNDAVLTSNGDVFNAQKYKSLPLNSISGTVTSNTKLALGQLYDGVNNGASNPPPSNDLVLYLTDGTNGLDLGTGVANLPAGKLFFKIANLNPGSIGDGIPDILITQIADPSTGVDKYEFTNASNATVGSSVNISFAGISAVANWTADFYEASKNPPTLTSTFTKTDRPLRLWAADFSYFGITAQNYSTIEGFTVNLNGNSDVAFIAYNTASAFITLPVTFSFFETSVENNNVILNWKTESENNNDYFAVETSTDGQNFNEIGRVQAHGNSNQTSSYSFIDRDVSAGNHFYRIKQVDKDAHFTFSKVLKQSMSSQRQNLNIYPNPATNSVIVSFLKSKQERQLMLYSNEGKLMISKMIQAGEANYSLDISMLPRGNYVIKLAEEGSESQSQKLIKK